MRLPERLIAGSTDMSALIETSGDIEIFCHPATTALSRTGVPSFEEFHSGDRVAVVFAVEDTSAPPYSLKIHSPTGANILDSIVRDLPTGLPYSAAPVEFVVSARGIYRIEIRELKGRHRGEAKLRVT